MVNLSKNFGKLTIPLLVLLVISFSALPALGQYGGGSGTAEDPYLIYTPAQMNTIGAMLLDWDKHFKLMANIDLSAYTGTSFFIIGIYPDNPFTGVFDGNGRTISNFSYYNTTGMNNIGLFRFIGEAGEIKDLGLVNADVEAVMYSAYVGSLVGYNVGTITNCYLAGGNVSGNNEVGGLVGSNWGTITGCYAAADVTSVYKSGSGSVAGGLVGDNYKGEISNCHSSGGVSGSESIGGLVGANRHGRIINCYSQSSVSGPVQAGKEWAAGGLVGLNRYKEATIADCYATGSVNLSGGNGHAGGLVGVNMSGGTVVNCYSAGDVTGENMVGGLLGENRYGRIINCYSRGKVSGSAPYLGGLIGYNDAFVFSCLWDVQSSGRGNMCGGGSGGGCDNSNGKSTAQMQDMNTFLAGGWDFLGEYTNGPSDEWGEPNVVGYPILWWQLPEHEVPALPTFSGGTGEPNDPYLISTTTDLNRIGHNGRLMASHFRLISDIDLAGMDFFIMGSQWYPYGGVFDGGSHTISNFTYSPTGTNNIGLFGYVEGDGAEIKNLGLIDPNIDPETIPGRFIGCYVGSLVGSIKNATLTGCYVEGGTVSGDRSVGGLVGENVSGGITDCYSTGSVSGGDEVGGVVGSNLLSAWVHPPTGGGTISNCYSEASVTGDEAVGGVVGRNAGGTVIGCSGSGGVSGSSAIGGLVGSNRNNGIIDDCDSSGIVVGMSGVGGLVGWNSFGATISNSYSTTSVSASAGSVGGLAGTNQRGEITGSYSSGDVTGADEVGGLVGYNESTITECYSTGDVTATGDYVGGLVGHYYSGNWGPVSNCYATGSVSGVQYVGGLAGRSLGPISNCYSTGDVTGVLDVGGLVGWNVYDVIYGIGNITNCYSVGGVSGTLYAGGLVGTNDAEISGSLWDIQTSGRSNMCGSVGASGSGCDDGYGKTTAIMQTGSTFISAGWDFVLVWDICEGTDYPKLVWQIPLLGDFGCPDGVDWADLSVLCGEWLFELIPADVWPDGGDGIVNFLDLAVFAEGWQITHDIFDLAEFADQWLKTGSNYLIADIAPPADGDGIVNMLDFAALADNWLAGVGD